MKTRLLGLLTPRQAAEVHRACLQDTLALADSVPGCDKWLLVAAHLETAKQLAVPQGGMGLGRGWRVGVQRGPTLGARLTHAAAARFRAGTVKVVVVGTDTPWMGRQRILRALALLDAADVVLGPTADGGYYLVAGRGPVLQIFRGIPWGSSQVLACTLCALKKTRTRYRLLPRDFDLDRPADLLRVSQLLREKAVRADALHRWIRDWEATRGSSRPR